MGGLDGAAPGPGEAAAEATSDSASTGELVSRLSQEVTSLVRGELELARLEFTQKGRRAGVGLGAFGAAGVVALYGVGVLIAVVVLALTLILDAWLAALIVAFVLLAAAAGMALFGKKQVARATPLGPERVTENLKRDVDAVKHHDQASGANAHGEGSIQ
ncbi:phage holin family protein [Nocardioides sp. DS6]|uniref:Phage holin family protein n=1 Tax=Nocardioides eburneus TaxID=3231482 RepID=A0ABV3SXX3_9ACTN